MMVFPEFQEADQVDDAEVFASRVKMFLAEKVDVAEMDQQRRFPQEVIYAFKKLGLYGLNVPKNQGESKLTFNYHLNSV
ncbi:unnamed protein product [Soboliphyme baturini]|uniref:Acyl-CoA_dh_N domain-containing protein n=1 Tax=Soboliphyme baturini TaxID=241478 RepID=A0A183J3K1_9BILA|nr:unnamed protein product [Soboliphyme baturini]